MNRTCAISNTRSICISSLEVIIRSSLEGTLASMGGWRPEAPDLLEQTLAEYTEAHFFGLVIPRAVLRSPAGSPTCKNTVTSAGPLHQRRKDAETRATTSRFRTVAGAWA